MIFSTNKLEGDLIVPSSKSSIHRFLFLSLLTKNKTKILLNEIDLLSNDIQATLNVLQALNCKITKEHQKKDILLTIDNFNIFYNKEVIDCNQSATTLRFAIFIVTYLFNEGNFTGSKKLLSRPMDFYEKLFYENNIYFSNNSNVINVKGNLKNIFKKDIKVKNCVSSQFISPIMLILPLESSQIKIKFLDKMESIPYLKMTNDVLNYVNINYDFKNYKRSQNLKNIKLTKSSIKNLKKYKTNSKKYFFNGIYIPEVDYSSMSFWLVANELGSKINIKNKLKSTDNHPDKILLNIIKSKQKVIDIKDSPDLLPILLIYASFKNKKTKIINYERNRLKESNRVEGMINQLNNLGFKIKINKKHILIKNIKYVKGGTVNSLDDHRLAMSFTIASLKLKENEKLKINNFEAINKSYPTFIKEYNRLKK